MIRSLDPFVAKLPKLIDTVVIIGIVLLPLVGGFFWQSSILFGLMFLTVFLWIIEKLVKTSYGYKTLFRLGMHGITWSILFSFLLEITNQKVDYAYELIFFVWMTFILIKNRQPKIAA